MTSSTLAAVLGGGVGPVPPIARAPLPLPLPRSDRDASPWATSLPWEPPQVRDYLRANLWAVEMPGAPIIPGVSSQYPERILSWFLDRYDLGFQREYLAKYAGYGYTHLYLSPPDSIQGYGRTLSQFVQTCELAKQYVPYVGIMLGSKVYQAGDMSTSDWQGYLDPLLTALLPVCDEFVPGWEWNLWNIPSGTQGPSVQVPRYVGQRAHATGKSCWMHFSSHVTWWGAAGTDCPDRFSYWLALGADVDGLNYQADGNWYTQEMTDRLVDTLKQFGSQPFDHKMRLFEDVGYLQFDGSPQTYYASGQGGPIGAPRGPGMTADDGDCRGWYACCTTDNVGHTDAKVWGFGNGGRRPDGSRL